MNKDKDFKSFQKRKWIQKHSKKNNHYIFTHTRVPWVAFNHWFWATCRLERTWSGSKQRQRRRRDTRQQRHACSASWPRRWSRHWIWSGPWWPSQARWGPRERRRGQPGHFASAGHGYDVAGSGCTFGGATPCSLCWLEKRVKLERPLFSKCSLSCTVGSLAWSVDTLQNS